MIDRSDFYIAGLSSLSGWGAASKVMAFWAAMGPWARLSLQSVLQGLITLVIGLGALTAQHYWRQYLQRRSQAAEQTWKEFQAYLQRRARIKEQQEQQQADG